MLTMFDDQKFIALYNLGVALTAIARGFHEALTLVPHPLCLQRIFNCYTGIIGKITANRCLTAGLPAGFTDITVVNLKANEIV